jgi:hypothetical protein
MFAVGKGNIRENSRLGTGRPTSFQRSWKNTGWERGVTQNDSKGFCEKFALGKGKIRENSRLHKGNIFPARKSLVSDMTSRLVSGKGTGNFL